MGCGNCDPIGGGGGGGGGSTPAPAPTATGQPTQAAFGPDSGQSTPGVSHIGNPPAGAQIDPNGGMNKTLSQIFGSTNVVVPQTINYTDPLGPNASGAMAPSGGPEMRAGVYSNISNLFPELQGNTDHSTAALKTAAANPGYVDATSLANKEIDGGFLNGSPQLDNAIASMRQGSAATSANQDAQIKSTFNRNGMTFGTGNQEAQQANDAANNATANQNEAAMRLQNYQTERGNQDTATGRLDNATGSPINYLSQVNAAELSPMSSIAQIVTGLSGGGNTSYQPQDVINNQGYLRQGISTAGQF